MRISLPRPQLVSLLASAALLPSMGLAEPWPTTEWEVHCYRPTCEHWYGQSGPCEDRSTSLEWHGYDQEVLLSTEGWDGSQECRPSGGPVGAEVKRILERASQWLDGHGFVALERQHRQAHHLALLLLEVDVDLFVLVDLSQNHGMG